MAVLRANGRHHGCLNPRSHTSFVHAITSKWRNSQRCGNRGKNDERVGVERDRECALNDVNKARGNAVAQIGLNGNIAVKSLLLLIHAYVHVVPPCVCMFVGPLCVRAYVRALERDGRDSWNTHVAGMLLRRMRARQHQSREPFWQ